MPLDGQTFVVLAVGCQQAVYKVSQWTMEARTHQLEQPGRKQISKASNLKKIKDETKELVIILWNKYGWFTETEREFVIDR